MDLNPIETCYRRLKAAGREPIKLTVGNPSLQGIHFPAELLIKAYSRSALNTPYDPDPKGMLSAREAIVDLYQLQGLSLSPQQILLTSGTSEAFFYLFSLLGQVGDNFLVPYPSYPLFEHIAQYARVRLKPYHLRESLGWSWNLDEMAAQVDENTRGIVVISPHNPTGKVWSRDEWRQLAEFGAAHDLPIISDEVFADFCFDPTRFARGMTHSETICFTLNGISKSLALPGHKLGWIIVTGPEAKQEKYLNQLELMADTFLTCNQPVQLALPTLLAESRSFRQEYYHEVVQRRATTLNRLKEIPQLNLVPPQGGFYLMAAYDDPQGRSEDEWVIALMESEGISVYPGYFFDHPSGNHLVMSFLTDPKQMQPALDSLAKFLGS